MNMKRREKFLAVLLAVSLALVFYLALSSRQIDLGKSGPAAPQNGASGDIRPDTVNTVSVENYRSETKELVGECETVMAVNDQNLNDVLGLERRLLAINVPKEYKDLHVNILLALIRMEDYINNDQAESLSTSRNMIDGLKSEYQWLD